MTDKLRPKIATLVGAEARVMGQMLDTVSRTWAEDLGITTEQARVNIVELIDKGLAKIEVHGNSPDDMTVSLVATEEGAAEQ